MKTELRRILTHPVTALSGVLAVLASAFSIGPVDAVATVIWTNLAQISTVAGIFGFQVAPELGFSAALTETLRTVALIALVAYAGKLSLDVYAEAQRKL